MSEIYKVPMLNKLIEGISAEEYHSLDGLSSTRFDLMRRSMKAFELRHRFQKQKAAFDEGQLIHDAILLPHLVSGRYIESPTVGLDTKAANALREEYPSKVVVGQGMIKDALFIAESVQLIYGQLLDRGIKEASLLVQDSDTGLLFKCRPDIYSEEYGLLVDVKSSSAKSPAEFLKVIEAYDYDMQIAWYTDLLLRCGYPVEQAGWLVAPKDPTDAPFGFVCSQELLEKGRSKYQTLVAKWIEYKTTQIDELFKPAYSWEFRKEMGVAS